MLSRANLCSDFSTHGRSEADDPALGAVSELDSGGDFVHAGSKSVAFLFSPPLHASLHPAAVGAV